MVVCIADSSSTFRRRIRNALSEGEDYEFAEANTGTVLMDRLTKYPVDIVIVTDDLDDMTGVEVVRTLRSHTDYANTPVFLLSRSGTHEDVLDAVESGVSHYVVLPFEDEVLADKVEAAAEQVRKSAEVQRGDGYTRHQII